MTPPGGATWRPAWSLLGLALGVLGGAVWLLWSPEPTDPPAAPPAEPAKPAMQAAPAPVPASRPAPAASVAAAPAIAVAPVASAPAAADDLAAHIPPGPVPTMNQVIAGLHQRGIRTGLGAFNPPGTRPALIGIAVPEDFELPPGYVRHHQATDDGQRIEAILMFDPDHPPPAAAGLPLATPAERVVPAELAPPGLPLRLITLPRPVNPGSPPR